MKISAQMIYSYQGACAERYAGSSPVFRTRLSSDAVCVRTRFLGGPALARVAQLL
jgi:hypothetical protein